MPLDAQAPDAPPDSDMATPAKNLSDLWQKRRATAAPLIADLKADQTKVKALEAAETQRPDIKAEEAPKLPDADPLKGFASAAGIFAMIASALTRTPANAAMSSMAQAITAQRQGEVESYKQHYQAWKDGTDEALKLDAAHRQKVSQALDIMKTNAAEGEALLRAADTEFGDEQGSMFQSAHLAIEREQLNSARKRLAMDMENHKLALEKDQPEVDAAMEFSAAMKSGDPERIAKAQRNWAIVKSPAAALLRPTTAAAQKESDVHTLAAEQFRQAHGRDPGPEDEAEMAHLRNTARIESSSPTISDEAATFAADRVLAGDEKAVTGLARTAANITKVTNAVVRRAAEQHMTGPDVAIRIAEFAGTTAGERTLGTRAANMEVAANETANMAPVALTASRNVDRTQYPSLNSVLLAAERGTGDPNVVRFALATNSLIYSFSKFLNPTGIPTDADKARATDILSTAWAQGQFEAAIDQISRLEIPSGQAAVQATRQEFRDGFGQPQGAKAAGDAAQTYSSADAVRDAFHKGQIGREKAKEILKSQFGYE